MCPDCDGNCNQRCKNDMPPRYVVESLAMACLMVAVAFLGVALWG